MSVAIKFECVSEILERLANLLPGDGKALRQLPFFSLRAIHTSREFDSLTRFAIRDLSGPLELGYMPEAPRCDVSRPG